VIRTPPKAFVDQAPYATGIAELDDGVKLTAQIVDCDFEKLKSRNAGQTRVPENLKRRRFRHDLLRIQICACIMTAHLFPNEAEEL